MFAVIGLVAFMLTSTYLDQDVGEPVHRLVAGRLARWGWRETGDSEAPLAPRPRRWLIRKLWTLQDCPFCLSTWVAFGATWYALDVHPWHRVFWLTWTAATGLAWLAIALQTYHQEAVEAIDEWKGRHGQDG